MTIQLTLRLALITTLACSAAACSGSGIGGLNQGAVNGDSDAQSDDGNMDTLSDAGPDRIDGTSPGDEPDNSTAFVACVSGNSETCDYGATTCLASETCREGLSCMAGCADTTCAAACLESASDEDRGILEGLLTCAAFAGCFDLPPPSGGTDCLEDNCELGNCLTFDECATVIECMGGCQDMACANDCITQAPPQAETMLNTIATCGETAGCFEPTSVPPTPGDPVCGDDVCDNEETCESCTDDCGSCPVTSGCCSVHDGPGCDDSSCEMFICEFDPTCCTDTWTDVCAETAIQICDICAETGPTCGDGLCEDGEDAVSCAKDCKDDTPDSCITDKCELGACMDFDVCADVVECMEACANIDCAQACLSAAPPAVLGLLENALTCAEDEGCFNAPPTPGPKDDCLLESCDIGNCNEFPECQSALDCMAACGDVGCASDCVNEASPTFQAPLETLLECGFDANCFKDDEWNCGDGVCTGGESCVKCPEDCGACEGPCCSPHDGGGCSDTPCQESVCNIDESCCYDNWSWECAELAKDFCPACDADVVCGDGECAANENPSNCPEDCQSTPNDFLTCISGVCGSETDACFDDPICADAFPCLEDCVNNGGEGCTYQCMPDPENQTLLDLGICGGSNGCGNNCGDGACGPGETSQSCPQDCQDDPGPGPGPGPGPDPTGSCILDNCELGWACGWGCDEAIACMDACADTTCAQTCIDDANFWQQDTLQEALSCAEAAGCF